MTPQTILLATLLLPITGAVLMCVLAPTGRDGVRAAALLFTVVTMMLVGWLVVDFVRAPAEYANVVYAPYSVAWFGSELESGFNIQFELGLDGLSIWLYGLSALLMFTAVLTGWDAINERPALYYAMLMLLTAGCLGVFAARDLILFYIFFEFTLIPLFFLIGVWGSEQREYAAVKFFLFTLAGSLLTFLGLLAIVLWVYSNAGLLPKDVVAAGGRLTFSIPELTSRIAYLRHAQPQSAVMPFAMQFGVFLALFVGFAIKVPLFPLHTWLPLAHVQAPTAGSVFLAGILLKIGTYGFLRFSIPMLPEAAAACAPWLLWLAVAGIIYGALVALAQTDMKRLIAYSSVSHLGFCMLGLFALNRLGTQGAVLQMVNHGISTGALFALVGMLYERYHTRQIADYGGLARKMPVMAFFFIFFTMSSIGLPGLNGFAGELLILVGMFQRAWEPVEAVRSAALDGLVWQMRAVSVLAVAGVVLGAWYMLWLAQRVFFGTVREPRVEHGHGAAKPADEAHEPPSNGVGPGIDLNLREILALAPLAVLAVWIGVQPQLFLRPMQPTVNELIAPAESQFWTKAAKEGNRSRADRL